VIVYKPAGIPADRLQWIKLSLDEFETIRLLDHIGLDQEQAAAKMGISRPTVTRVYASARRKIADALVTGQAICIEGGPVTQSPVPLAPCCGMGRIRGRCRHGQLPPNQQENNT
jgi:predicted DNA-binding protein (UPF0251 family)